MVDLQAILPMSQLQMQLPEDTALIAPVLYLHAGPPGVAPLRGLDVSVAPHASSALRIQ